MKCLLHAAALLASSLGVAVMGQGCFFIGDDDEHERDPFEDVRECQVDADCGQLATDDVCYSEPYCDQGSFTCRIDFQQDDDLCQCDSPFHCELAGLEQLGCNIVSCTSDHQCVEEIVSAGPSPAEVDGDCQTWTCDGESAEAIVESTLDDLPDDANACTADTCSESGPEHDALEDGSACGSDGVCYATECINGCQPENPDACGDEGPNEPTNDDGFAATSVNEFDESCGMLDADDIDWFEVYIEDEDFETDVIGFDIQSSANSIELCAYVVCEEGAATGGCANMVDGPIAGARGCCWNGAPSTLSPTWDLDCTGTSDDSGTMFFSLRAPNGDACETYRISAHY